MPNLKNCLRFLTPCQPRPEYPLFVFLPGMDGTGRLLHRQIPSLQKTFDIRCLAIPPDDLTDWDAMAKQVIALIEAELKPRCAMRALPALRIAHRRRAVYLCGESFGGCLAQKVIMHAKGLIERLILINPASSFKLYPWMSLGEPITRALPSALYRVSKLGILPFLADWGRVADWEVRALWSAIHSIPQATFIWRLSLLGEFHISETQLSCITQPTLLLASGADRLLPSVTEAQRLNSCLPKAQMVVLSDSCHACLLERSVDLYQILQTHNFLSSGNAVSLVRGAS